MKHHKSRKAIRFGMTYYVNSFTLFNYPPHITKDKVTYFFTIWGILFFLYNPFFLSIHIQLFTKLAIWFRTNRNQQGSLLNRDEIFITKTQKTLSWYIMEIGTMHIHKHILLKVSEIMFLYCLSIREDSKATSYAPNMFIYLGWNQGNYLALPSYKPQTTSQGMPYSKPDSREVFTIPTILSRGSIQFSDSLRHTTRSSPLLVSPLRHWNLSWNVIAVLPHTRPTSLRTVFWYTALVIAIRKHDDNNFPELLAPTAETAYKF